MVLLLYLEEKGRLPYWESIKIMIKLILSPEELKTRRERLRLLTSDGAYIGSIVGNELLDAIKLMNKSIVLVYDTVTS